MAWVNNIVLDTDKPNTGNVSTVFTDTDGSTFTATARGTITNPNGVLFRDAAIAARNAWQTRKAQEATDRTALNNLFTASGEASSSSATNNGSITINLPG